MALLVRKGGEGGLVKPIGPTPFGVLDLSVIDRLPVLRCNARTLHVFKEGSTISSAAHLIREAFSKALVPYYPLAGRLKLSPHHQQLQIECSAQGIWFEVSSANCTLHDVNYLEDTSYTFDKLLPQFHSSPSIDDTFVDPLVLVQVTEFKCGGLVVGLTFCHSICDGLGAAQFLKAVGDFARGANKPSIAPVWCREYLLPPPLSRDQETNNTSSLFIPPPLLPDHHQQLEHASFDISTLQINQLKQKLIQNSNAFCSSFEIVAATLWRQRTRATLNLTSMNNAHEVIKLVFFANCREMVKNPSPLPDGFYGNCFFPVTVTASNNTVAQGSLAEVVKLIQDAKAKLPAEFSKWLIKKTSYNHKSINENNIDEHDEEDPFAPGRGVGYQTLFLSEWGRLGFNEVNYGWGKPLHVIPVQGSAVIPVGIVSKQPLPKDGIRLMTWCVHKEHLSSFVNKMSEGAMMML